MASNNAAEPMIFPKGPLHVTGQAQLIPSVDLKHDALLISRLAGCVYCEYVMCWLATGSSVALAAWPQRATTRGKVK